ncbi:MAG: RIP metalloprotease RseP [Elusimicrobia bacterium]|nr:RIP metalloprotease RseP [Elusimicrobiota bacterium]
MVIISIVLALGLVVFVHESGHFVACRLLKIKVLRFAFGFGKELFGFTRGDTRYSICAFPLGGFVKPAGEDPEEITGAPDEFFSKSWKARILVALAGPGMNYVLSFALFFFTFWWFGTPEYAKSATVGTVFSGSPAEVAGLKSGDVIERVYIAKTKEDVALKEWDDLSRLIHNNPETTFEFKVQRQNQTLKINATSKKDPARGIGLVGIAPQVLYKKEGVVSAVKLSGGELVRWSLSSVVYLWDRISKGEKPDLAGPVGIVSMMSKAANTGAADFLALLAIISVAIGFFNLFPIPLLDGGHVVFYLWEAVSRRKITRQFLMRANTIGLAILIPIFLFAFYNDLERLWSNKTKAKTEFEEIIKK